MFANGITPWTIINSSLTLWHNPWANHPIKPSNLKCNHVYFTENENGIFEKKVLSENDLYEILNIDKEYLLK